MYKLDELIGVGGEALLLVWLFDQVCREEQEALPAVLSRSKTFLARPDVSRWVEEMHKKIGPIVGAEYAKRRELATRLCESQDG